MEKHFDIVIVGGGLIGQTAALALSTLKGLSVALIDQRDIFSTSALHQDGRATALSSTSLNLFKSLGVVLDEHLEPIQDMLITEGAIGVGSNWRLHFQRGDVDHNPSQMIENSYLAKALKKKIERIKGITLFTPAKIKNLNHTLSGVMGEIDGLQITADLLIGADGRNSFIRRQAGIITDGRDYAQHALVTTIHHTRPHEGLALQRFLPGGPLAVLPLPNQQSQIVWSDKAAAVEAAIALSEKDFISELELRVGDHLGDITLAAPRQSYPLSLQISQNYVATRLALIGDAAHIIHPLAGQGLNLGIRDIAALYDVLSGALATGQDIGGAVLGEYESWRKSDVTSLAAVTDGLSYLYASPRGMASRPAFKALGHLRRVGLKVVDDTQFLKTLIMNEAEGKTGRMPTLLLP